MQIPGFPGLYQRHAEVQSLKRRGPGAAEPSRAQPSPAERPPACLRAFQGSIRAMLREFGSATFVSVNVDDLDEVN
ncbi:hypothetical protein T484DRAFT_1823783 [Baffinella frigidus]|nr:hypothetical protein T484DRAFT_1823783 [Cryptophyta sp. CCMP2293]